MAGSAAKFVQVLPLPGQTVPAGAGGVPARLNGVNGPPPGAGFAASAAGIDAIARSIRVATMVRAMRREPVAPRPTATTPTMARTLGIAHPPRIRRSSAGLSQQPMPPARPGRHLAVSSTALKYLDCHRSCDVAAGPRMTSAFQDGARK